MKCKVTGNNHQWKWEKSLQWYITMSSLVRQNIRKWDRSSDLLRIPSSNPSFPLYSLPFLHQVQFLRLSAPWSAGLLCVSHTQKSFQNIDSQTHQIRTPWGWSLEIYLKNKQLHRWSCPQVVLSVSLGLHYPESPLMWFLNCDQELPETKSIGNFLKCRFSASLSPTKWCAMA